MTDNGFTVEPVLTDTHLDEFIELPLRLHGRDRYVPLLRPTVTSWFRGTHAQARYGPVRMFVVRDPAGAVVGRFCLHSNPMFSAKMGVDAQLFGLTEFADAPVLAAITECAEAAAVAAGRRALIGPVALLPNQTGGVVTSGFADRGFVDSPWNPEYYPKAFSSNGYTEIFPGWTWLCENLDAVDPGAFAFDDARLANENLTIHRTSRLRFRRDLPALRSMLNAAFAQLDYYTTIEADDLADQTAGLELILDKALVVWVAKGGQPVAFVWVVPDLSDFVRKSGGRLGAPQALSLLGRAVLDKALRRRGKSAILIVKGTVPGHQGKGYLTLLSRELLAGLHSRGYRELRSTFVGDDNPASAAQYERMNGRRLHRTVFYRKEIR